MIIQPMDIPPSINCLSNAEKIRIINNWGYTLSYHIGGDDHIIAVHSIQCTGAHYEFNESSDVDEQINKAIEYVYQYVYQYTCSVLGSEYFMV